MKKYSPILLVLFCLGFLLIYATAGHTPLRELFGESGSMVTAASLGGGSKQEPRATAVPAPKLVETAPYAPIAPLDTREIPVPQPKVQRVATAPVANDSVPVIYALSPGKVAKRSENEVSVGVDAGFTYVIPTLRFQRMVTHSLAVSAQFSYSENISGSRVTVVGGGLGVTHYFSQTPFRGPFLDVGIALYQINAANRFRTSQATPMTLSTTLGIRSDLTDSLNLLAGVGLQYADNRGQNIGDIYFNGVLPLLKLGIGYDF